MESQKLEHLESWRQIKQLYVVSSQKVSVRVTF